MKLDEILKILKMCNHCSGATKEQISEAYHKRALETHPDKGGSNEEFRKVQQAYNEFKKYKKSKGEWKSAPKSEEEQNSKPETQKEPNFESKEQNKHKSNFKTNENTYHHKQKSSESQKPKYDFSFKFINDKAKNTFNFNPSEDIVTKKCYEWPSTKKCLGGTVVFSASSKASKVNISKQESNLVLQMKTHSNIKFDIYSKMLKDEDIKKLESKQLPVYCNELSEKAKSFFEDGFRKTSIDGSGNGEHYHNYDFIKSHPEDMIDMRAGHSYFMYQCAMKDAGDQS